MPLQHSDTAFIPCLNLCWCIHKAGQEFATGTHHSGNQSFLPFSPALNPHREVAVSTRNEQWLFLPTSSSLLSFDLNPPEQGVAVSSHLRGGAFSQMCLGCRTNQNSHFCSCLPLPRRSLNHLNLFRPTLYIVLFIYCMKWGHNKSVFADHY